MAVQKRSRTRSFSHMDCRSHFSGSISQMIPRRRETYCVETTSSKMLSDRLSDRRLFSYTKDFVWRHILQSTKAYSIGHDSVHHGLSNAVALLAGGFFSGYRPDGIIITSGVHHTDLVMPIVQDYVKWQVIWPSYVTIDCWKIRCVESRKRKRVACAMQRQLQPRLARLGQI